MKSVSVEGARLEVFDEGAGLPLLFVHGFPLDHTMWQAQIEHFTPRFRVIAPDLRGCGGSDVTTGTVSMERFADDLSAILDQLQITEPVVYCGLSMGGYIAWQFWRKYPEKLRALVLCDTKAAADTPEGVTSRMKMLEHVLRAGTSYLAEAMLPRLFAPESFERRPEAVAAVRERILAAPPEGVAATLRGLAAREDFQSRLSQVRLPALVVCGEHDAISPPDEMRQVAAALPEAQFELIPGAGHLAPLENPEAVNAVFDEFLTARVSSESRAAREMPG